MLVDISTLNEGVNKLELRGDAESLDMSETEVSLEKPVAVELTLNVFEENIRIDGTARTQVAEECSRCLEQFKRSVEVEIHLYAVGPKAGARAGKQEEGDEEQDAEGGYLIHDGRQLDLREEVRSAILLSSPMQPLCRPNCRGLCPECGENLNLRQCSCGTRRTDRRWRGLEKLRGGED